MGRKFYVSGFKGDDPWVDHALKTRREGVNRDGAEETPVENQVVYSPGGRRIVRPQHQDAAVGMDSEDVHMGGDRCVVVAENPTRGGDLIQTVERYDGSGKFVGSYEVPWHKIGQGRHQKGTPRRIYY